MYRILLLHKLLKVQVNNFTFVHISTQRKIRRISCIPLCRPPQKDLKNYTFACLFSSRKIRRINCTFVQISTERSEELYLCLFHELQKDQKN